jgi:hypothetical protein
MVTWKRYDCVTMNPFSSLGVDFKRIDLLEDDILILDSHKEVSKSDL